MSYKYFGTKRRVYKNEHNEYIIRNIKLTHDLIRENTHILNKNDFCSNNKNRTILEKVNNLTFIVIFLYVLNILSTSIDETSLFFTLLFKP